MLNGSSLAAPITNTALSSPTAVDLAGSLVEERPGFPGDETRGSTAYLVTIYSSSGECTEEKMAKLLGLFGRRGAAPGTIAVISEAPVD